jgi:hypothetical protein
MTTEPSGITHLGGYLRGCDRGCGTFRDELAAASHPRGGGMTHSGATTVELVRCTWLFPGAPYAYAARACQPDLHRGRLLIDDQGQVIAPADVTA